MNKLRSIQVLRAVAALAVVGHHFFDPLNSASAARLGAAGVDLFFVISGLIMATIGAGRPTTAGRFLADRAWRILPLWLLAAAPWLVIYHGRAGVVLTTLTLWPVWGTYYMPALTVGWSLSFELLFYVVFAIGLVTRPWVPLAAFPLLVAGGALFPGSALLSFIGNPLALEFLAGVIIARLPVDQRTGSILLAIGVLLFAGTARMPAIGNFSHIAGAIVWQRVPAWGIPSALVVYGARSLDDRFARPAFDLPVLLGDASFSIYLFHKLFTGLGVNWLVDACVAIVLCVVIHVKVERPLTRLKPRAAPRSGTDKDDRAEFSIWTAGAVVNGLGEGAGSQQRADASDARTFHI